MSAYTPTRRGFLRDGAVLVGATLLSGCAPEPDGGTTSWLAGDGRVRPGPPTELPQSAAFPLGVATGDADSRGPGQALFWAHHRGSAPLRLVIWKRGGGVVLDRPVEKKDGFVHADVIALEAGVHHDFAFVEMDGQRGVARSPIGGLRAPYGEWDLPDLTIGAYACTKNGRDFSTLLRGAERDLDGVLLLGDGAYTDGAGDLTQYRAKWAENLATAPYRALRARAPYVTTWDDHEVENNWNPEGYDPARLAAASRAFFESQPIRRDPAAPDRIWRSVRFGASLEVFVLDCKSERRQSQGQYITRAQMDWLKAGLDASPCPFKMIMSSLPIGDFPWPWDFVQNLRWWGYPQQRTEILSFIEERGIEGVIWLAGDFHIGTVGRVAKDGLGSSQWEILCGPGAQRGNPLVYTLNNEQWPFATATSNITVFHLEPRTQRATVQHIAGDGEVLNETVLT